MDVTELTYKELYDLLGKAIESNKDLRDKQALIMIGSTYQCKISTVRGLEVLKDSDEEAVAIQGAWNNGKPVISSGRI